MKALVFIGGEVRLESAYPDPVPGTGEALVRVSMAGICATDLEIVKGYMGYEGVLGHEFVGIVEESQDAGLRGRRVTGAINIACGGCEFCGQGLSRHCPERSVLGILGRDGAFAEYLVLPEANLHVVPDNVADEEAVFIEPLASAFEIAEQVRVKEDDRICVLGDGRLGLLAAQVLSLFSRQVVAVGRHPEKLAILAARGLQTSVSPPAERIDLVVDCTGAASGIEAAMSLVRPRGTIVLKTTMAGERNIDLNRLVIDELTLIGSRCGPFPPAIEALAAGKVDVKPLIGRIFPLDEGVNALAHAARKGSLKVLLGTFLEKVS